MSETANSEGVLEAEKPVTTTDEVKFPPFPEPTDKDFDDVPEEERKYYLKKFPDLHAVKSMRLHCTACDRHLGSSARNVNRMRAHPMLRTLVCHTCHTFYNSGEFEKGDDGSELYCRWCGQGGQVYCCSNCPHVFCAKCIKRNFGNQKIKSIESTDDWKCFKCIPESLLYLRAFCWAVLRYCDLKNEIAYKTEDPHLREIYQKDCAHDYTECCKTRNRRKEKVDGGKKKESENKRNTSAASIISKIPSTIQVKKFASMSSDDTVKPEKKATKRPASPRNTGILIKNPITIAPGPRLLNPISLSPAVKKLRVSNPPAVNTYSRVKHRAIVPVISNYNGFNNTRMNNFNSVNMVVNDNINLSLDNLTQGLDMATMTAMNNGTNTQNDDVVCTPDFPMEPLCEVNDNDDDVQCITPDPVVVTYKNTNPPPLVPRGSSLPDLASDNIIQMTENDVSVNLMTGGLKFRVDPQTLSSNKMYRLPDGRVFAIKANPNMPGGYSATIVAVSENAKLQTPTPKGITFSAKVNAIPNTNTSTPIAIPRPRNLIPATNSRRNNATSKSKGTPGLEMPRECDLSVPVEWYRYNLIDAVDALEYSLSRLHKLKKEASTMFLRTRNLNEMRNLHRTLDRLLNTSSKRFHEIRDNLGKEMKQFILKKKGVHVSDNEDDDDVEILTDVGNDDPIFIDENSVDSNANDNISQEVDLTGTANSEHDSAEKVVHSSSIEAAEPLPADNNTTVINSSDELQVASSFIENDKVNETNNKPEGNINDKNHVVKLIPQSDGKSDEQLVGTDTGNDNLVCNEVIDQVVCENQSTEERVKSNGEYVSNIKEEIEDKEKDKDNNDHKNNEDYNVNKNNKDNNDNKNNKDDNDNKNNKDDNYNKNNKDDNDNKNNKDDNDNKNNKDDSDNKSNKDNNDNKSNKDNNDNDEKIQDTEMSNELIENLLNQDIADDTVTASNCLDIPDLPAT